MLAGPLVRKRKTEKRYKQYARQRTNDCDFCEFSTDLDHVIAEYPHFWVVTNMFSYDIWDGISVVEHLMVVPKRHVDGIGHFGGAESKEFLKIISQYESDGYSIYARAAQNIAKSIPHQHTHLIKLGNKKARALLFVHKPHVLRYF